jgi:hypothetical protein
LPANLLIVPFVGVAFPMALIAGLVGFVSESGGAAVATPASLSVDAIIGIVTAIGANERGQLSVSNADAFVHVGTIAASVSLIAMFSVDSRRAIRRSWRWGRHGHSRPLILGALGLVGFAIGLAAAAR